jgi:hypothetical protein
MAPVLVADRAAEDDLGVASYFEVHVRRDERWMIDCTSATAAEALTEAEDIVRRGDVTGVKVVNERYNPRTDQSAGRVIFKFEKPERKKRGGTVRMIAAPRVVPAARPVAPGAPDVDAAISAAAPDPAPATPSPDDLPRGRPPPGARGTPSSSTAPWLLFAWASLALALGASALFVLLLVIG